MSKQIRIFLLILIVLIISLLAVLIMNSKSPSYDTKTEQPKLPDDVEQLIKKYTYQENDNGLDINITGNLIVFRGKKMLGLRSNLVKATYFEAIRGTLRSKTGLVEFSASEAEWELSSTTPLVLRENISITFNKQIIPDVKKARVYCRQGILEVINNRKEIFHFR